MNKLLPILTFLLLIYSIRTSNAQGPGSALNLDGINDVVAFSNDNRGVTNQLTVEAWIKTSSMGHQHIISKYDRDAERGFQLLIQNGKACLAGRDGSGLYRTSGYSNTIVADDNWHHIAGVVQNGTWMLYVDGVLEQKSETGYTNTILNSNEKLWIGNYYYVFLGNHFYRGLVDEVKLWKRALTADEIRQNMCSSAPSDSPDLVGYFKFDDFGDGIIKDHSTLKMHGVLQNTTPPAATVTSGAPIGNRSVYRYTTNWNSSLEMTTEKSNFSVINVDPAIQGFHLYTISSPPTPTNGINKPQEVKEYFGLFKVGTPDKKYKVYYKDYTFNCGGYLYRRQDNTASTWSLIADTTSSPVLLYTSSANYGEFAASSQSVEPLVVTGPAEICAGSTATLSVANSGQGQILWSTGETSASITVNQGGKYEVTVTDGSCTRSGVINVREATPFTFSLGEDLVLCNNSSATLSAPAGMASYKWSTGETSASINITKSGTYLVEVTSNAGCTASDEISVTINEEPEIPLPGELKACYGEQVMLDATVPGAAYLWSTGQTTPTVHVSAPSEISVSITLNGCTYTRQVAVSSDECPLIPNIITPNNDGKNDAFVVQGVEQNTLELKIFNRWGKSVYQSDRYDNNWSAAGMPAGVYYYQFTSSRTGKVYKGWLEVIK